MTVTSLFVLLFWIIPIVQNGEIKFPYKGYKYYINLDTHTILKMLQKYKIGIKHKLD